MRSLLIWSADRTTPPKGAESERELSPRQLASYRQVALGAYSQAQPLFERALAIREKSLGAEHPDTARKPQ